MIVAYVLIAIGGWVSLANWLSPVLSVRGKRNVSAIPVVGAVLLGLGLWLLPATRSFAWIALFADYGTLILIVSAPWIAKEMWLSYNTKLVHSFSAEVGGRLVTIKLYEREIAHIRFVFDPVVPRGVHGGGTSQLGLVGKWSEVETGIAITDFGGGRRVLLVAEGQGVVRADEHGHQGDAGTNDTLDGVLLNEG